MGGGGKEGERGEKRGGGGRGWTNSFIRQHETIRKKNNRNPFCFNGVIFLFQNVSLGRFVSFA